MKTLSSSVRLNTLRRSIHTCETLGYTLSIRDRQIQINRLSHRTGSTSIVAASQGVQFQGVR